MSQINLTPGGLATLACMLEVSAPKPGNVHRGADFEDVTFQDFATSAVVLGEVIQACAERPMGETILRAVEETLSAVGTNTNLGMILLIVPLAKVARANPNQELTIQRVRNHLAEISSADAADVFRAIRTAKPGGLGDVARMDVNAMPAEEVGLLEAMQEAADRDLIAKQYVSGFSDVIEDNAMGIVVGRKKFDSLSMGIVFAHVVSMSREPDSLIVRKCGVETAAHAQMLALKAIEFLTPVGTDGESQPGDKESFWNAVGELDFWLRSDGNRRNPGTTADLIAASLFVGIHNGTIKAPFR